MREESPPAVGTWPLAQLGVSGRHERRRTAHRGAGSATGATPPGRSAPISTTYGAAKLKIRYDILAVHCAVL